ncbi:MAG: hypothetical protein PHT88_03575 [Candidatus Moranbacteria bacterium]|nr:hypothetical protein [Candidatus Moranbacteria bacterium]
MASRNIKRTFIALVYVIILSLLMYWVYAAFLKAPETCSDGIKNQNEAAIDCGGVCGACEEKLPAVAMQVKETSLVYGGPGSSDVLVKVYNPNDRYGALRFAYTVSLKDSGGAVLATKTDTSFMLPKETKYLMQVGMATTSPAASADVTIDSVEWQSFAGYQESPVLNVLHKRYGPVTSGVGFGQVDGTLSNESGFDFQSLMVKIILRDASGKALAVNQTEMRTVINAEQRDFRLIWPTYFAGDVTAVETEVEADVYHSDNFIRQYLPGGAFQRF